MAKRIHYSIIIFVAIKIYNFFQFKWIISILCRQGFEISFVLFNFNTFSFILVLQNIKFHSIK